MPLQDTGLADKTPTMPTQTHPLPAETEAQQLGLPVPEPEEQQQSHRLLQQICTAAGDSGIPFSEFMRQALYAPELGYYSSGRQKFGTGGDFVTAPELGAVFATCVANQVAEVLTQLKGGDVLEAGAGQGRLAIDMLRRLDAQDALPRCYLILELSAQLQARQQHNIREALPHLVDRVQWISALPEEFVGVVVANELLDALPVEQFEIGDNGIESLHVCCRDASLEYCRRPAGQNILERLQDLDLPSGYRSEINFQAEAWIRSAADAITKGVMLFIDYGFSRAEYYHAERRQGTLMCHYRHHNHDHALSLVGLQDITAHVDFTAMAEAAFDAGMDVLGYTSQAAFLMGNGLSDIVQSSDPADSRTHLALTTEIKKLTHPTEMGELFKVVAFGKGYEQPLAGFSLQDRTHRL